MTKSLGIVVLILLATVGLFAAKNTVKVSPVIFSINPVQGSIQSGGATIILTGQGFSGQKVIVYVVTNGNPVARPVQRVGSTQLIVTLQPGDLSSARTDLIYAVFSNSVTPGVLWSVNDGTVEVTPSDVVIGANQQVQFSATSTFLGDSITWSLQSPKGFLPQPPPVIDQTGLFTAPSSFTGSVEQIGVVARSAIDPSKYEVVMVTIQ